MNNAQKFYSEHARWIVKETYFGKFNSETAICTCYYLSQAALIIDGMIKLHAGRCFEYKAEKIADDYDEIADAIYEADIFNGEIIKDYGKYLNGISCLGETE